MGVVQNKSEISRIKTYIDGFDKEMQGGIPQNHIVLFSGTAGTMKSSLTFNILYNEILHNNRVGLYLTLEQSSESLLNHMINLDYDLGKINIFVIDNLAELTNIMKSLNKSKEGSLIMADLGSLRKEIQSVKVASGGDWINVVKNLIRKLKESLNLELFVLDSLSALYVVSDFEKPRVELFHLFEFLRDLQITTFLISEMPLSKSKFGEFEIESFLADGVIMLDLVERHRKVSREISVIKMRATQANNDVFTLDFAGGKFKALYGGQPALV
jgi:KaiC/GvpD/RAD55 family RecA-like ATPase